MHARRSTHRAIVFAGYCVGAVALYRGLPEHVPPALTVAGAGTLWLGAPMAALLLPTAIAVTDALLRPLCVRHPVDEAATTSVLVVYDAVMRRFSLFVIGVHLLGLLAMLGQLSGRDWATRIVPLMLGVTMISIGNLLPMTRPNLVIGIRTRRTLSDRALWIRAHRLAGYITVACGLLITLSAVAAPPRIGSGMILVVGPAAFVSTWLLVRSSGRQAHA